MKSVILNGWGDPVRVVCANTQAAAKSLLDKGLSQLAPLYGIIERNTDSDWFSFWAGSGV